MNAVHRPSAHDAALLHVAGRARYLDDIPSPGTALHLAFGFSSIARGEIRSVDLSEVVECEGVACALVASDLPAANDVSPSGDGEPLLATNTVNFVGQPIFIVAASSHKAARMAARLANVSYRPLEPVLSIEDAQAAGNHLEEPLVYALGNAAREIERAPLRVSGSIAIGGQEHFYLEGQAALAIPQEDGSMLIHSSTQHPSEIQHKVADTIGRPMSSVRVEVRRMGGGFGGKESQANAVACACAAVASLTGRPCRMRLDRDDDFIMTGKRHDCRIDYRAGFDSDGQILGIEFNQFFRCGWSRDLSLPVADRAMLHSDNAYFIPAIRVRSERLQTNTQSATAFRGFGGPQGMLGIERVIEHIAHALRVDPVRIRKRNYYRSAANGDFQSTFYRMPVRDCEISEITDELIESSDYLARVEAAREWNACNRILKRGIGFSPVKFGISFTLTHLNQAGALVHIYQDGSIQLNHGGTEMGQGLFVKVAQIAANEFGQPLDAIRITATDTSKVPNTSATAASSGSDLNGMAVRNACQEIVGRLVAHAAEIHQVDPDAVSFRNGRFEIGSESSGFGEIVRSAYLNRISLSATGFYATPEVHWDRQLGRGRPFYYFAYGAAVSEVVIDTLTGENRILRADILHESGRSLNPAIDIGQVEGGYVQGAGWLTTEELVWDQSGRLMTHAPSTYKIPACSDRPRVFNVALWDKSSNREDTIHRSKAVGEPPLMLANSVLAALSDAVAACGDGSVFPALDAPATPERILAAVNLQKTG